MLECSGEKRWPLFQTESHSSPRDYPMAMWYWTEVDNWTRGWKSQKKRSYCNTYIVLACLVVVTAASLHNRRTLVPMEDTMIQHWPLDYPPPSVAATEDQWWPLVMLQYRSPGQRDLLRMPKTCTPQQQQLTINHFHRDRALWYLTDISGSICCTHIHHWSRVYQPIVCWSLAIFWSLSPKRCQTLL